MLTVLAVLTALIWLPILCYQITQRGVVVLILWLFLAPVASNLVSRPGMNPLFGLQQHKLRSENAYLTAPTTITTGELLDPTRCLVLLFLVLLPLHTLLTRQRLTPLDRTEWWMGVFTLLLLASALLQSRRMAYGLRIATDAFIVPFLGYYIARRLVTTEGRFFQLTRAIGYMGGYLIVIALIERMLHPDFFYRLQGPFAHRDHLYMILLVVFAMVGLELARQRVSSQSRRAIPRSIARCVLYGVPVIILLTWTRGNWLGFLLGLWICTLLGYRLLHVSQRLRLLSLVLLLVPIVLLSLSVFIPSHVVEERLGESGTVQARFATWQLAIHEGLKQPLLGIGLNNLRDILGAAVLRMPTLRNLTAPHNCYLSILVELGVVGLFAYLMLIVSLLRTGIRLYRTGSTAQTQWRGIAILFLLTAHFIPAFFSTILYNPVVSHVYVFACIGAIAGLSPAPSPRHAQLEPVPLHPQEALARI
jgi:O-antigen ligase